MRAQTKLQPVPVDIPINQGTQPDWITRLGYPNLINLFVGESGFVYSTPRLVNVSPDAPLTGIRAIHYTRFLGGTYIVVLETAVYRLYPTGVYTFVASIQFSGLPVQIDENIQEQVIIVDGLRGYVYDQHNNIFVQLNEANNGFGVARPISVVVLNTIAIVLDGETDGWIISDPNNALVWPALANVPTIESQLTQAVSLETLDNNLYIFGSTGIERWEPSNLTNNPYLFPFTRDNNFRKEIGALATNGVIRGAAGPLSKIYFISSQYLPMALTPQGIVELPQDGNMAGMARIISQYPDVNQVMGSFYSWRSNYFAHFTFPDTGISWVYTENSGKWFQSDDLVVAALPNNEVVATKEGIFNLSFVRQHKHRRIQSPRITDYKGLHPYRNSLNGVEACIVQGEIETEYSQTPPEPEQNRYIELTISIDSESWLTTVPRILGKTGERNARTVWDTNLAVPNELTVRIDYYGDLDLTFEKITAKII